MIFCALETEAVVQVGDRTRLSALKSYASKDGPAITKVEIEPEAGNGFINVTGSSYKYWFTDWEYATAGTKVVTLKINGDTTPVTKTYQLLVLTEADDMLFATDADLTQDEPDILKYVKLGRNSYKDIHREVQRQIVDLLNRKGYRTTDGAAITKSAVKDLTQVREMAKYLALQMIYNGQSNTVNDIFGLKAAEYQSKYELASQRQMIGLDLNLDGTVDYGEGKNLYSARLVRR